MTHERFEALAEAYGGDVSRWPADAREAAALLMTAEPGLTSAVLARAGQLDAALHEFAFAPASGALTARIITSAPAPRNVRRGLSWLLPAGLGAGLAAACAAGVMVGVQLSDQFQATDAAQVASVADIDVSGLAEESL